MRYIDKAFAPRTQAVIEQANVIIQEYEDQGFTLTLRQLYYQFVARDLIPNRQTEYKRLGGIINDARLAGLVDWSAIDDGTRFLRSNSHWATPGSVIRGAAASYRLDRWAGQAYRPEVWIEKDALVGVIEPVCTALDVPFFSCRGYTSQSEMWRASQRLLGYEAEGHQPIVIHLGDHDPSGIDMTRDIDDRLALFTGGRRIQRIALNMDQVQEHNPPPNPAKMTDSRFAGYVTEFGPASWELDALPPATIASLIRETVEALQDPVAWEANETAEATDRALLRDASSRWSEVVDFLEAD